jgi:hypothetical protein
MSRQMEQPAQKNAGRIETTTNVAQKQREHSIEKNPYNTNP